MKRFFVSLTFAILTLLSQNMFTDTSVSGNNIDLCSLDITSENPFQREILGKPSAGASVTIDCEGPPRGTNHCFGPFTVAMRTFYFWDGEWVLCDTSTTKVRELDCGGHTELTAWALWDPLFNPNGFMDWKLQVSVYEGEDINNWWTMLYNEAYFWNE